MRGPVVPAKIVFVKEQPDVSHAERGRRKIRRQDPPPAQRSPRRGAVEARELEASETQSRSRAGVHDEQILVCGPEQGRDSRRETQQLNLRRPYEGNFPEDDSEYT